MHSLISEVTSPPVANTVANATLERRLPHPRHGVPLTIPNGTEPLKREADVPAQMSLPHRCRRRGRPSGRNGNTGQERGPFIKR